MRSCALIHKVTGMDPTLAPAPTVLDLATIGAARTVGLGEEIGSLEVGKKADLITVDTHRPHMTPLYSPESHLVYTALPSDVRHTVVQGRVLMADRELTTIDLEQLRAQVAAAASACKG
jgi:5-methylthioadenosine/S-adenosylhomocysteine deaminase